MNSTARLNLIQGGGGCVCCKKDSWQNRVRSKWSLDFNRQRVERLG